VFRSVSRHLLRAPRYLFAAVLAGVLLVSALACTPDNSAQMGVQVAQIAKTRVGKAYGPPYYGPDSFSCDGLVWWSFQQLGKTLPHGATNQYYGTQHISAADARPGDLVFYHKPGDVWLFGHVAIVTGPGTMVNAENPRSGVHERPISYTHFAGGYEAYGRVAGF
jgi:cell wall-associated NlpC family hydrolase